MFDQASPLRRGSALAAVAALHLLAGLVMLLSWRQPESAPPERIVFRIIAAKPEVPPAPATELVRERRVRPMPSSTAIRSSDSHAAVPISEMPATAAVQPQAEAASAASAPGALDPGITARVIAEAARQPSFAYQGRIRDGKAMPSLGERLETGTTRAGRRDCLNAKVNPGAVGDTTMKYSPIPVGGLLALPFAVADALTGKCGL